MPCQEIRDTIVLYISNDCINFITMSYNLNGDNFSTAEDYVRELFNTTAYGGYCKLVAAENVFPFIMIIIFMLNLV